VVRQVVGDGQFGEEAVLEYSVDGDAEFDLTVDGVEEELLTVNA